MKIQLQQWNNSLGYFLKKRFQSHELPKLATIYITTYMISFTAELTHYYWLCDLVMDREQKSGKASTLAGRDV